MRYSHIVESFNAICQWVDMNCKQYFLIFCLGVSEPTIYRVAVRNSQISECDPILWFVASSRNSRRCGLQDIHHHTNCCESGLLTSQSTETKKIRRFLILQKKYSRTTVWTITEQCSCSYLRTTARGKPKIKKSPPNTTSKSDLELTSGRQKSEEDPGLVEYHREE